MPSFIDRLKQQTSDTGKSMRRGISHFRERQRESGLRKQEKARRTSFIKTQHLKERETSESTLAAHRREEDEARRALGLGRKQRKVLKREAKASHLAARATVEKQIAQQIQREAEARKELRRAKAARRNAEAQRQGSFTFMPTNVRLPSVQTIANAPAKILSFPLRVANMPFRGSPQRPPAAPARRALPRDLNKDIFGTGIDLI